MPRQSGPVIVERVVAARRSQIFELLATPSEHRLIDGSGMLQTGRVSGPPRLRPEVTFALPMKQSVVRYRSRNEVTEFVEGERLAWRTVGIVSGRQVIGGQVWRWILTDQGQGSTLVRHEYDWEQARASSVLNLVGYPARMRTAMEQTLLRLEHATAGDVGSQ